MLKSNLTTIIYAAMLSLICYQRVDQLQFSASISEAMQQVDAYFVRPVDRRQLFESAMNGMVKELDPYSSYIPPSEYLQLQEEIEQHFGGIGVAVEMDAKSKRPVIINVRPEGPADQAGVRVGDIILKIAGKDTSEMDATDPVNTIRGEPGTSITLTVQSVDQETPHDVEIVRGIIPIESVLGYELGPDHQWRFVLPDHPEIGYIWLESFGDNTTTELTDALTQIKPTIEGLIIDLRANPGGLLTTAVKVCDMFVDHGNIVTVRSRYSHREYDAKSKNELIDNRIPMVVLIDRYSASASEIFAACLQDDDRAAVMGERTWGKGTVQSVIEMEGGRSALRLTTATYWRPSGVNIHRHVDDKENDLWGVRPDEGFEIRLTDEQYLAMMRSRRNRILGKQANTKPTDAEADTDSATETATADLLQDPDPHLKAAVEYLLERIHSS